jgi:WhiB family redox-sensing transcriptional regulator
MAITDVAWRSSGACQGLDAEIFYPENEDNADFALSVCEHCAVRIACLNYALDTREQQGVWGGATARDRRKMLRQRRHTA